jgi:hypothetical protein
VPSREVIVVVYHRGLQAIAVTTRVADDPLARFAADPYCRGDVCDRGTAYTVPSGWEFRVVGPAWMPTHAWGIASGLVITVDGDITVADLQAILDSLPLEAKG